MTDFDGLGRLDAADPLAAFRGRFGIGTDEPIQLDGHSPGRMPPEVAAAVSRGLEEWRHHLVGGRRLHLPGCPPVRSGLTPDTRALRR